MAIVTALLHLFVFGLMIGALETFATRMVFAFMALPVLGLHVAIWAVARLSLAWGIVAAVILNIGAAAGGWVYWSLNVDQSALSGPAAMMNALTFAAVGLATAALLIAWVRFVTRRPCAAA